MKTLAYLRTASGNEGIFKQGSKILDYAEKTGMKVNDFIEVRGVSGNAGDTERKIDVLYQTLMPGDTLIVTDLARLSRNSVKSLEILTTLKKRNITVIIVSRGPVIVN